MQYKGAGDAAPNSTKWFFCFFASDCNSLNPDWPLGGTNKCHQWWLIVNNLSNTHRSFKGKQKGQIWTVQFLTFFRIHRTVAATAPNS